MFFQTFLTLADVQTTNKFTHYDLHRLNVLLVKSKPKIHTFDCYGTEIQFESEYTIKFIDFGFSYINGTVRGWVEEDTGAVAIGVIPSAFDNMIDYGKLYSNLILLSLKFDIKSIDDIFAQNGFYVGPTDYNKSLYSYQPYPIKHFHQLFELQNQNPILDHYFIALMNPQRNP